MDGYRTERGLEFLLRPRGIGRFFGAGFLAVWLCGWAAGEVFACWLLFAGAKALLLGIPPQSGQAPLALGPALAMGCFLLVWLTLWTFGGYAAIRELLRLLWSADRIVVESSRLLVLRRLGPFRNTVEIPREALRRIYVRARRPALCADIFAGPMVLSVLGSRVELERLAAALRDELRVAEDSDPGVTPTLPDGWQEIVTPEGDVALVADLALRRKQSRVALFATLLLATVALIVGRGALREPRQIGLAVVFGALAAGLGWIALRLALGRIEWRIGAGALTERRRFRSTVRDLHEAVRLELTQATDSDGDDWFDLEAVAAGAPEPDVLASLRGRSRKGRRSVLRVMEDAAVPRRLGAWLAQRARIPFADRTALDAQAREQECQRALAQLRASGALGRGVAALIERAQARRGN